MDKKFDHSPSPKIHEIDISKGWDSDSYAAIFMEELMKLPFYKPDLLYSGFNAESIGKSSSSRDKSIIFCSTEGEVLNPDMGTQNAINSALLYDKPAIAIYDPSKMEQVLEDDAPVEYGYYIKDSSAQIAIIRLKVPPLS